MSRTDTNGRSLESLLNYVLDGGTASGSTGGTGGLLLGLNGINGSP